MRMYSLYDRKRKEFGQILLLRSDEEVFRFLDEGLKAREGTVANYPQDFDVKFLGDFDTDLGLVVPSRGGPQFIVNVEERVLPYKGVLNASDG